MKLFCRSVPTCLPVLGAALVLILGACSPGNLAEAKLERLKQDFKAANQADSIEPMLALYHLEGANDSTVRLLKNALDYELGLPIASIEFEPLTGAPEECIHYTHDGVEYGPSLPPSYRMRVDYKVEDRFSSLFTIGLCPDGNWRIICAKPKSGKRAPVRLTNAPF
ncbi:MAG: hypothetical protein ACPGKS_03900 [Coraliomargarita sp.]